MDIVNIDVVSDPYNFYVGMATADQLTTSTPTGCTPIPSEVMDSGFMMGFTHQQAHRVHGQMVFKMVIG